MPKRIGALISVASFAVVSFAVVPFAFAALALVSLAWIAAIPVSQIATVTQRSDPNVATSVKNHISTCFGYPPIVARFIDSKTSDACCRMLATMGM